MDEELLDELGVDKKHRKRSTMILVCISLSVLAILIGVLFALDEITSIVASGPVVLIIGALTMVFAVKNKRNFAIIQSALTIGIPILVFITILAGELSPGDARKVLPYPLIVAALVHLPFSIYCIVRESKIGR